MVRGHIWGGGARRVRVALGRSEADAVKPVAKDADLVKPIAMVEEIHARLRLDPNDAAARQAWDMLREKFYAYDDEAKSCARATALFKANLPAQAIRVMHPTADLNRIVLDLLEKPTEASK
jgi:hypothetical protein